MDFFALWISTGSFSGLLPYAPGTWGTLLAALGILTFNSLGVLEKTLLWGVLFILGVWAATRFQARTGKSDASEIVIDEILGMGIAAWTVQSIQSLFVAFVLFRLFDIVKPFPIRKLDQWSKKQTGWKSGLGVILDDLLAGLAALLVIWVLQLKGVIQ